MMRVGEIVMTGVAAMFLMVIGCSGVGGGAKVSESRLRAIPPLPEGFVLLPSESVAFRAARIRTHFGEWRVNFDDGITKIETSPYLVTKLEGKWYPEEGGADAALCRGYGRGDETMVRMEGSSDVVTEETRIFFKGNKLREVVKYSIPTDVSIDPTFPPRKIPYSQRVKRERF